MMDPDALVTAWVNAMTSPARDIAVSIINVAVGMNADARRADYVAFAQKQIESALLTAQREAYEAAARVARDYIDPYRQPDIAQVRSGIAAAIRALKDTP